MGDTVTGKSRKGKSPRKGAMGKSWRGLFEKLINIPQNCPRP